MNKCYGKLQLFPANIETKLVSAEHHFCIVSRGMTCASLFVVF